ncbi:hypothetical protein AMS68_002057 [Peltaster fructicola]|uniref:Uncharacterized protein n=1 Tax=Peltaster fructicola TaxID=286661 RepID=A0A6H0XPY5_9PEZI|nr:hypothetical protein AMS68_002057 [Peltaster fructicola]
MSDVKVTTEHAEPQPQPTTLSPDRAATRRSTPSIATVGRVVSSFQRKDKQSSSFWKSRRGYGLKWFKKWDHQCFQNGRVLLVDYISNDHTRSADARSTKNHPHLAVASQEFDNLEELKAFYDDPQHVNQAALRVIHVQNATWAHAFLFKMFNIDHDSDLVGMKDFTQWTRYEQPQMRNGRPYPSGRSWPVQIDPWRNVSRTAIGVDYIRCKETPLPRGPRAQPVPITGSPDAQVLFLNASRGSSVDHGHEVSLARFAVYAQRSLGTVNDVSPSDTFKVPYVRSGVRGNGNAEISSKWKDKRVEFDKLDNSSTIIIFEDSASTHYHDCLIGARTELENKWRRLSFYLKKQQASTDSRLAAECSNIIMSDVFHALAGVWEDFLGHASEHVALLEDKIYEDPTDESRAPELWTNQAAWLKVDKVMYLHRDILSELQGHLTEMSEDTERREPWLTGNGREFERLAHAIQEDLMQPTNNLIDLMYKSVGIRDSKQSLQLGLSMWRLSWITFIFLPLTFVVGFFSMQVDIFTENTISVGWYFLGAGLTMIVVLFLWYGIKSSLQTRRQTIYQRGLYEQLYNETEQRHPRLWTDRGPAPNIKPRTLIRRLQWNLLSRWFSPRRTISKATHDWTADDDAGFGYWAKLKRHFLRTWLGKIDDSVIDIEAVPFADVQMEMDAIAPEEPEESAVMELAKLTTPVLIAEAEPDIAVRHLEPFALRLDSRGRRGSSASPRASEERPSSRASDALIIERRDFSDLESDSEDVVTVGAEEENEEHAMGTSTGFLYAWRISKCDSALTAGDQGKNLTWADSDATVHQATNIAIVSNLPSFATSHQESHGLSTGGNYDLT